MPVPKTPEDFGFERGPFGIGPGGIEPPDLATRLDSIASWYASFPGDTWSWFAARLRMLADRARFLDAKSANDFDDKESAWQRAELDRIAQRQIDEWNRKADDYQRETEKYGGGLTG